MREIRQYGGFGTLSADSGIRATANSMQIQLGHGQVREVHQNTRFDPAGPRRLDQSPRIHSGSGFASVNWGARFSESKIKFQWPNQMLHDIASKT